MTMVAVTGHDEGHTAFRAGGFERRLLKAAEEQAAALLDTLPVVSRR